MTPNVPSSSPVAPGSALRARGVERMKALASQYYAGTILTPDLSGPDAFAGIDVVIHPGWFDLVALDLGDMKREIVIELGARPRLGRDVREPGCRSGGEVTTRTGRPAEEATSTGAQRRPTCQRPAARSSPTT